MIKRTCLAHLHYYCTACDFLLFFLLYSLHWMRIIYVWKEEANYFSLLNLTLTYYLVQHFITIDREPYKHDRGSSHHIFSLFLFIVHCDDDYWHCIVLLCVYCVVSDLFFMIVWLDGCFTLYLVLTNSQKGLLPAAAPRRWKAGRQFQEQEAGSRIQDQD